MNMINNIFSIFDPSSYIIGIGWIIFIAPIILIAIKTQKPITKIKKFLLLIINKIQNEIIQLIKNNNKKISSYLTVKLFLIIIVINISALIPFNFTTTAHISTTFSLSFIVWISIIIWGWINSFKKIIIHLTPIGTPNSLINFIVIIERIRNLIRPITLSIRLSANLVAGHLLVSLLSKFSIISKINITMSMLFIIILSTLEIIVAVVQAYVLSTLLTLYHNERIE